MPAQGQKEQRPFAGERIMAGGAWRGYFSCLVGQRTREARKHNCGQSVKFPCACSIELRLRICSACSTSYRRLPSKRTQVFCHRAEQSCAASSLSSEVKQCSNARGKSGSWSKACELRLAVCVAVKIFSAQTLQCLNAWLESPKSRKCAREVLSSTIALGTV